MSKSLHAAVKDHRAMAPLRMSFTSLAKTEKQEKIPQLQMTPAVHLAL